jgi:uncharacterized protein (UPF0147 family)
MSVGQKGQDVDVDALQKQVADLREVVTGNQTQIYRLTQTLHGDADLGFTKGLLHRVAELSERVEAYQMDTQEKINQLTEGIEKLIADREEARLVRDAAEKERMKWLKIAGGVIGGSQAASVIWQVIQAFATP